MVGRAVVQSTHWYELRGREKHREEMQTERRKETGKERKGRETPTQAPHSRGTQKMHYCGCCDVIRHPSGPSPRGPSPLASLFQSAASSVHQHHWLQPLRVSVGRLLAPFPSFGLCGLLHFDCPDVPRLPKLTEPERNAFADLPTTILVQLFHLLILYLFCLFLRQVFFLFL